MPSHHMNLLHKEASYPFRHPSHFVHLYDAQLVCTQTAFSTGPSSLSDIRLIHFSSQPHILYQVRRKDRWFVVLGDAAWPWLLGQSTASSIPLVMMLQCRTRKYRLSSSAPKQSIKDLLTTKATFETPLDNCQRFHPDLSQACHLMSSQKATNKSSSCRVTVSQSKADNNTFGEFDFIPFLNFCLSLTTTVPPAIPCIYIHGFLSLLAFYPYSA